MKKLMRLFAAMLAVIAFSGAAQARMVDVSVENQTGKTITYLYISHAGTSSWEEDILGPDFLNIRVLDDGHYCEFRLDNSTLWDMKAVFRDGSSHEYYDFDLRYPDITLHRDRATFE